MVSIAPNQFEIEGLVLSKEKDSLLTDFSSLVIKLNKVKHIQGPGDFLDSDAEQITVSISTELASTINKGDKLQCMVRKAPGHFFVIPDSLKPADKK